MSTPVPITRIDMILFLGGITALTAISIDIVLPATGVVAREFGVAEQYGSAIVGAYFAAYAVGQLFWGLFSDAYGRRLALGISLTGFGAASIACALATDFTWLIFFRCLQGIMCGAPVIARAIVRDTARGEAAARMMAVLAAILTVSTLIAPVIGSGLLILFDWHAIFAALALLAAGYLAFSLLKLPETAGERRPERFRLGFVLANGRRFLTMRAFLAPTLVSALTFGGYAAILSVGAVVVEESYGISPGAFGSLFALAALSNTAGALTARHMLKSHSLTWVVALAVSGLALAGAAHFALFFAAPGLTLFWGGVCLYVLAFGVTYPTVMALAMEPAGDMPGFASSLLGSIQIASGTLGAAVATALFDGSHRAVSLTMAIFAALAITVFLLGRGRQA